MYLALISLCNGTCWDAEKQVPLDNISQVTWKSLFNMPIPQMIVFPMARQSLQRATSVTAEAWIFRPFYSGITQTLLPVSALHLLFCVFFVGTCHFGVIGGTAKAAIALQSSPVQQGGKMPLAGPGKSRQRVCVKPLAAQPPPTPSPPRFKPWL